MLKTENFPERRKVDFTHSVDKKQTAAAAAAEEELLSQDTMTEHMQMLYAKYNRAGFPFKDGNTVRSFKAHWGRSPHFYARDKLHDSGTNTQLKSHFQGQKLHFQLCVVLFSVN